MGWTAYIVAVAVAAPLVVIAADVPPPSRERPPAGPPVARLDLTRLTIIEADYAQARRARKRQELAAFDREVVEMLRCDPRGAAASPDERVARLAGAYAELAGKLDRESVGQKLAILGELRNRAEQAQLARPLPEDPAARSRHGMELARERLRMRP